MENYKLEFKLKQHTPIIHFQHEQHGATLRGSELKPKLDKYILKKLGKEADTTLVDDEAIYEKGKEVAKTRNWLVGKGEHQALDYKVRIESESVNKEIDLQDMNRDGTPKTKYNERKKIHEPITKAFPMFFSTMGEDWKENKKEFCFNKNIFLNIISSKSELVNKIKEIFPLFIFLNNFGTRQSKGFGSYFIDEKDKNYISPSNLIQLSGNHFWQLSFSIEKERDINVVKSYDEYQFYYKVFNKIDDFCKAIRSGINLSFLDPPFYLKSLLYIYITTIFQNTWEKKKIKDYHFSGYITKHTHLHPGGSPDSYLYRDMLGLSNLQEWKLPYNDLIAKEDLMKDNNDNLTNDFKIDRYKSPVTIIPFQISETDFIVYLSIRATNPKMLNRKFEIKSKSLTGQEISTPPSFATENYLDFLTGVDLNTIVDPSMNRHWYFKKLNQLFSTFQRSN